MPFVITDSHWLESRKPFPIPAKSLNRCVPPSNTIGSRKRINAHHGNGFTLRRNGDQASANNQMLVYSETMRSDQATFQPITSLPVNCRRTHGLRVFFHAAWISVRGDMGFCPKRKNDRSGN